MARKTKAQGKGKRRKASAESKAAYQAEQQLQQGWNRSFSLLTRHLKRAKPATREMGKVVARSAWQGMPSEDSGDPLHLAGMEHVLSFYPDEDSRRLWRDAADVSAICIDAYIGASESEYRGTYQLYDARFVQLVDPESQYGKLLARQEMQGEVSQEEDLKYVTERKVTLAVLAATPTRREAKVFKINDAPVPSRVLLDFPVAIAVCREPDDRPICTRVKQDLLTDKLSDLEIDRLWELGMAVVNWIISPSHSLKWRKKEKERLTGLKAELEQRIDALTQQGEKALQQSEPKEVEVEANAATSLPQLEESLSIVEAQLENY